MVHASRRNEDGRSHGELNSQLQTKKYQVSALSVVIGAQRCERTESMGQVVEVGVVQEDSFGAAFKAGSWKDAVREVVGEVGVFVKQFL